MKILFRSFAVCSLIGAIALLGQQDLTVQWKVSLDDLERRLTGLTVETGSTLEELRLDTESLRSSIASFASSNPDMKIQVPAALPDSSSRQDLAQQVNQLNAIVTQVIQQTPGTAFNLGRVGVTVSADSAETSPVTIGIDQSQIANLNLVNAAQALDYLPGVSIQHLSANRNEAGIMVRGFSTRGQVPLYVDGIPISVPYDGYVDFNRFLTSDIAEVQVARGYSSPLLGPNALGEGRDQYGHRGAR